MVVNNLNYLICFGKKATWVFFSFVCFLAGDSI